MIDKYSQAVANAMKGKCIPYKRETKAVLNEMLDMVTVKHGHWDVGYFHDRVCSCCLHPSNGLNDYPYNFCPHCGAKMTND